MRNVLLFFSAALLGSAVSLCQAPNPTVAEARTFLAHTNEELQTLGVRSARAEWVAETHITDDTEVLSALVNEQLASRMLALVAE
jgi:peptidyl-dipeptidase A